MSRFATLALFAALAAAAPLVSATAVEHRSTERNQPAKADATPCREVDRGATTQKMPSNNENARHGENQRASADCAAPGADAIKDTKSTGARRHTD